MADALTHIVGVEEIAAILGVEEINESRRAVIEQLRGRAEAAVKDYLDYDPLQKEHVEFLPSEWRRGEVDPLLNDVRVAASTFAFTAHGRRGNDILQLRHVPVALDDTLEVREHLGSLGGQASGAFPDSSILNRGTDYYLDVSESIGGNLVSLNGHLRRNGVWLSEPRTIKITYNGGWGRADLDEGGEAHQIKMATLSIVQKLSMEARTLRKGMPIVSESYGGEYSVSYDAQSVAMISGMAVTIPPNAMRDLSRFKHFGRMWL